MGLLDAVVLTLLLLGPLAWLRGRTPLPSGWHPLLVLCCASLIVLVSGLLGALWPGVLAVCVLSLGMAVLTGVRERTALLAPLRDPVVLTWLLGVTVLAVLLHGQTLTHYDNFSHWGLVIAVMLQDGRLPNGADAVIGFPTYPLGAASLGYLSHRVLGVAESSSMLAQAVFITSSALPVASAAGRRPAAGVALHLVAASALLTTISGPTNLLVDSLVAALAGALLALILLVPDAVPRHPWAFALVSGALIMTKSSGTFFVGAATLVAIVLLLRRREQVRPSLWVGWLGALALPWLLWWWWGRHVEDAFVGADASKHSGSAQQLSTTYAEKTPQDRQEILGDLLTAALNDARLWTMVLVLLLTGAVAVRSGVLRPRTYRLLLTTCLLLVVLWEVALGLMYLWSMPLAEADNLAGFQRYQATLHLVLLLLLLTLVATVVAGLSRPFFPTVLVAVPAVVVALTLAQFSSFSPAAGPSAAARVELEDTLAGTSVSEGDEVCLLLSAPDNGFRTWITRYLLLHDNVRSDVLEDAATGLPGRLDGCDLLVLLDQRPSTAEAIRSDGLSFPDGAQAPAMIEP